MKVSQTEVVLIVGILLYIVFFSHSPPVCLRNALGNIYVLGSLLAVLAYITLNVSSVIGVLLILAFLLTMTRVTEHLDVSTPSAPDTAELPPVVPTNTPPPPSPPASTTVTPPSPPATPPSPPATPPSVTSAATTSPAPSDNTPPLTQKVEAPTPVMSCNIESFASF